MHQRDIYHCELTRKDIALKKSLLTPSSKRYNSNSDCYYNYDYCGNYVVRSVHNSFFIVLSPNNLMSRSGLES